MRRTNKILSIVLAVVMLLSTMGVSALAAGKTGLYKVNNKWCYVKSGKVDYSVTGLFKHTNGKWYYVKKGVVQSKYTGLVKHTNGKWYYIEKGVKTTHTGIVKHTNGNWYHVEKGVKTTYTGLVKHTNGKWYYVKKGAMQSGFTGLVKHTNGKWYHVKNGVKTTYTGFFEYEPGKWYYVKNGEAKVTYTGLAKHTNGKWYYVKNGTIDFSYSGYATYNNKWYVVENGVVKGGSVPNPNGPNSGDTSDAGSTTPDTGTSTTPDAGTSTSPDGGSTSPDSGTLNDIVEEINNATAKAAKASYDWSREAKFTRNIDVGSLTGMLDSIIKAVDKNANLNSVVGGFLDITGQDNALTVNVVNGQLPESGMKEKYLLKAMTLTEGDIQQFRVNGNTYMVQIKDCTNPDANSAWAHASNDYITYSEVNSSIAGVVGEGVVTVVESESKATYKNIILTAVIENGQLTSLEYKYTFDATLKIKLALPSATGTTAAEMRAKYTNFQY